MLSEQAKKLQEAMQKALEHTRHEFNALHTGKASPAMVESVLVDVYGSSSRLRDIAAITTPDARMIVIQPWDRGLASEIEKGIRKANIGLNPSTEGAVIRCPVPEMSKQRRTELVKVSEGIAEHGRVGVRAARKEAMDVIKHLEKEGVISEDDLKRLEKDIQKHTDRSIADIAKLLEDKEKELMR